ncbi:MAG: glutathione S-transferase N-terminal domain-containing protein [Desulforhopalus sp.]
MQLYVREGCPFCEKVEKAARQMGLVQDKDYQLIDAAPLTPGREVVIRVGGKAMVPFLIDGEISMYESADIISYMEKQVKK